MSIEETNNIQVFVVSPNGGPTRPVLVNPSATVDDLRHTAAMTSSPTDVWDNEELPYWNPRTVRLSADGRPLLSDAATLQELGIVHGSVIRTSGRLRGGGPLSVKVKTKFGCICCCNHCTYDCCSSGRKYEVTVNSIDDVSSIFNAIALQNPKWAEKKASGILIGKSGVVLEPDRKILFYDLKNGDEIWLQLIPTYWFTSDFRKKPKAVEDDEADEEFQQAVKEAKEAKKKAAAAKAQKTDDDTSSHHDSKEGVEDIELGSR